MISRLNTLSLTTADFTVGCVIRLRTYELLITSTYTKHDIGGIAQVVSNFDLEEALRA